MERYISFKLLTSIEPVSIKTTATNMAELTDEILKNETLLESIQINPVIEGTSKSYMVLVDSKTGEEYSFDKPNEILPEGNRLFYIIPVTSKFGQENKVSLEINGFKITITIEAANEIVPPKFTTSDLKMLHSEALKIYNTLNRKKNNLIIAAQEIEKKLNDENKYNESNEYNEYDESNE